MLIKRTKCRLTSSSAVTYTTGSTPHIHKSLAKLHPRRLWNSSRSLTSFFSNAISSPSPRGRSPTHHLMSLSSQPSTLPTSNPLIFIFPSETASIRPQQVLPSPITPLIHLFHLNLQSSI